MKESDLIKKMQEISDHLYKTGIINKVCILATEKGEGKTEVGDYNTLNKHYKFADENIEIIFTNNISVREIRVDYFKNTVLFGSNIIENYHPFINEFSISTYKPGEWEDKINRYFNEGEITKKDLKEFDIPEGILTKISERFNVKF